MEEGKQFSLRWDKHAVNLASEAECFFQDEAFLDCTLFAEGQCLQAHKLILSAASPYLATLLRAAPDKHPILIFNDIRFDELKGIVAFIYNGSVNVPEANMGAFLHAAQALLVRGLTHASKQWQSELNVEPNKRSVIGPKRGGKQPITKHRSSGSGHTSDDNVGLSARPTYSLTSNADDNAFKLHEVSMSNYLPSPRRHNKPVSQNPNFVMSSWKLGAVNAEENNGHRKPEPETETPPAHLFKKFRLEKPPPPVEEEKSLVIIKQEVEEESETIVEGMVEPKVEVMEDDQDCTSGDSREPFYHPPDEAPVPLLVCKTSLQEDNDGNWSNSNNSPDHGQFEAGQDLPCHRCHKRYKSRYALNRHVLYECGKARKSFSCDECGKKVTRQDTLQKHKLIHLVQHMKEKDECA